ncbi:hypothetical protein EVAR_23816_1 [Eumeta japonica]|uniref:Uncharacterized protein n=1 Tax=Eumeta variegata TaxID=151549 RepID=A0A4C1VNW6_EUMVA|nr:hypothetical protein EVAR_23816_1 [Eumeta japonica]
MRLQNLTNVVDHPSGPCSSTSSASRFMDSIYVMVRTKCDRKRRGARVPCAVAVKLPRSCGRLRFYIRIQWEYPDVSDSKAPIVRGRKLYMSIRQQNASRHVFLASETMTVFNGRNERRCSAVCEVRCPYVDLRAVTADRRQTGARLCAYAAYAPRATLPLRRIDVPSYGVADRGRVGNCERVRPRLSSMCMQRSDCSKKVGLMRGRESRRSVRYAGESVYRAYVALYVKYAKCIATPPRL